MEDPHLYPERQADEAQFVAIVMGSTMAIIFGYYALRLDEDPESCLANDDQDTRIAHEDANAEDIYEDVGYRFRLVFTISFYASLV